VSGERLSAATQALLKAARHDAPSAAARANVWGGVSATVGGAAGAAAGGAAGVGGSGGAAATAGIGAAKMLVAGTLLGGAVTVGLAAMLLRIGPSPSRPPASTATAVLAAAAAAPAPPPAAPVDPALVAPAADSRVASGTMAGAGAGVVHGPASAIGASGARPAVHVAPGRRPASTTPSAAAHPSDDDPLTREASLVAEARSALARGDAQMALRLVRAARSMPSPQLVPEELTVEAQAQRSLGNADGARAADATLHSQYPDSALAK
jgi:hypothetical protein